MPRHVGFCISSRYSRRFVAWSGDSGAVSFFHFEIRCGAQEDEGMTMIKWQCETCGAVYEEYVNGCPKCWHGDPPTSQEPEVRSKVVAVKIDHFDDAAGG